MGFKQYHEPSDELPAKTRTFAPMIEADRVRTFIAFGGQLRLGRPVKLIAGRLRLSEDCRAEALAKADRCELLTRWAASYNSAGQFTLNARRLRQSEDCRAVALAKADRLERSMRWAASFDSAVQSDFAYRIESFSFRNPNRERRSTGGPRYAQGLQSRHSGIIPQSIADR